eukprot:363869-Chlamydomonas_euryale.AAC.11
MSWRSAAQRSWSRAWACVCAPVHIAARGMCQYFAKPWNIKLHYQTPCRASMIAATSGMRVPFARLRCA